MPRMPSSAPSTPPVPIAWLSSRCVGCRRVPVLSLYCILYSSARGDLETRGAEEESARRNVECPCFFVRRKLGAQLQLFEKRPQRLLQSSHCSNNPVLEFRPLLFLRSV